MHTLAPTNGGKVSNMEKHIEALAAGTQYSKSTASSRANSIVYTDSTANSTYSDRSRTNSVMEKAKAKLGFRSSHSECHSDDEVEVEKQKAQKADKQRKASSQQQQIPRRVANGAYRHLV